MSYIYPWTNIPEQIPLWGQGTTGSTTIYVPSLPESGINIKKVKNGYLLNLNNINDDQYVFNSLNSLFNFLKKELKDDNATT